MSVFDFRIDTLHTPNGGRIALCPCPGGLRADREAGEPDHLEQDLEDLREWGAHGIVSLIEQHEFERLTVTALPIKTSELGLWWRHLPIRDMQPPGARFEERWHIEGPALRAVLREGGAFAIHCWAGLGRTGTVAARLLVEMGMAPAEAVRAVRDARRGSIQTELQEQHVHDCKATAD